MLSEFKRVEFVNDKMSCSGFENRWCDTVVYVLYAVDLLPCKRYNIYTYTPYAAVSPKHITN